MEEQQAGIRLNKWIADAGYCSRREADRLIEAGKVSVDGKAAAMGQKVLPGQCVTVEGHRLMPEEEDILLAVNKPAGVVCTTDTRWGDKTVDELLHYPKRLFYAGRLDKNSQGLLLMTNMGELADRIMKAGNYHEKEYVVQVNRRITPEFLQQMGGGVYLHELGVKTRPCRVARLSADTFSIVLTQGLNRQIRRMCRELGFEVVSLTRIRIMDILLEGLKPGEYRRLSREEIRRLERKTGGKP